MRNEAFLGTAVKKNLTDKQQSTGQCRSNAADKQTIESPEAQALGLKRSVLSSATRARKPFLSERAEVISAVIFQKQLGDWLGPFGAFPKSDAISM